MKPKMKEGSFASMVSQLVAWLGKLPDFLKPERIQNEGVVHRPRSLASKVSELFAWLEAMPAFVKELFGSRRDDTEPESDDNEDGAGDENGADDNS